MSGWWSQFRHIGIPRCSEVMSDRRCRRLIWPWQPYVADYEEWPVHHSCHHGKLDHMHRWSLAEEDSDDMFDRCRFCGRESAA